MDIKEFDRRLQAHDWHYSFSDDRNVYRRGDDDRLELEKISQESPQHDRLFRSYSTYNYSMPHGDKHEQYELALSAARISVGASTETIAVERERREREFKEREARELAENLRKYDRLCAEHEWFYWHFRIDSHVYRKGFDERNRLLISASGYKRSMKEDPFVRLFEAWAHYQNCLKADVAHGGNDAEITQQLSAAEDRLDTVRKELGIA